MSTNEIDQIYKYFDSHFETLKEDIKELKSEIKELHNKNENKIQSIDKELFTYRMVIKYPKLIMGGIAILLIASVLNLVAVYKKAFPTNINITDKPKIEQYDQVYKEVIE